MEFVKKNLVAIILGVVCLLAVAALFYPIGGMYDGLNTELADRVALDSKLRALTTMQRQMPLIDPDKTDADPLTVFPVDPDVLQPAMAAVAKISAQAKALNDAAVKANTHPPFIAGVLPKPTETQKIEFAGEFSRAVADYSRWREPLHAGRKPTEAEVTKALADEHDRQMTAYVTFITAADGTKAPDPASVTQAEAAYAISSLAIKPAMVQKVASEKWIYLEDGALVFDPTIQVGNGAPSPSPEKIWDAQLSLWVTDDIMLAIKRANENYADPATPGGPPVHDVLHNPIKRLEKMDAPVPVVAKTNQAADETTGNGSAVAKEPTASASGRVCNSLYDVVSFNLDLVVDAAKVPIVLRELQANQFITVLNVQQTDVVDPATAAVDGFVYGDKPVVELDIQCEELFMRAWTGPLEPDSRKVDLGAVSTSTPTP